MSYTNRNFTWDFDALKRFYELYIVKWLNSAVSWTNAQKKQARSNLGFGNGDIDDEPTAGSDNLVKSGGVYKAINLSSVKEVNDFVVDIVLKEGVSIDWTNANRIVLSIAYLSNNMYHNTVRIRYSDGKPNFNLLHRQYDTYSEAEQDFGKLLETSVCYIVLKHPATDGQTTTYISSNIFHKDISWGSRYEHPIINEILLSTQIGHKVTDFSPIPSDENYPSEKLVHDKAIIPIANIEQEIHSLQKKPIKILCFGNSFTLDCMSYVPFIVKNIAPEVELTLALAYIGGSTLAQHTSYITGETLESDNTVYYVDNGVYKKRSSNGEVTTYAGYVFYKSVDGEPWVATTGVNVEAVLASENWDIITYQGSSTQAHKDWNTYYAPYIYKLQKALFNNVDYAVKLGWVLIHSGRETNDAGFVTRYNGNAENAETVMQESAAQILFPYGTAVQNLRTVESLRNLGDSLYHNLLVDDAHIQDGIGCLTAAYTNALTILQSMGIDCKGVIGETTRPNDSWITEKNIPGPSLGTSGVIGISEKNCFVAQIAAIQALKKPYEITDMNNYNI